MPRKRTSRERPSAVRDASIIVIASEGEKTEPAYFEFLKNQWHCSRTKFKILTDRESGHSAPKHVLKEINDFVAKQKEGQEADHLCLWTCPQYGQARRTISRKPWLTGLFGNRINRSPMRCRSGVGPGS